MSTRTRDMLRDTTIGETDWSLGFNCRETCRSRRWDHRNRMSKRSWLVQREFPRIKELLRRKKRCPYCLSPKSLVAVSETTILQTSAHSQARLRELENKWWQDLAHEIQGYDTNNMHKFYDATKRIYSPQKRANVPVRDLSGVLMTDGEGMRRRWVEHFCTLLNHNTDTDHNTTIFWKNYPHCQHLNR